MGLHIGSPINRSKQKHSTSLVWFFHALEWGNQTEHSNGSLPFKGNRVCLLHLNGRKQKKALYLASSCPPLKSLLSSLDLGKVKTLAELVWLSELQDWSPCLSLPLTFVGGCWIYLCHTIMVAQVKGTAETEAFHFIPIIMTRRNKRVESHLVSTIFIPAAWCFQSGGGVLKTGYPWPPSQDWLS